MSRYLQFAIILFALFITQIYCEKPKTCADFGTFEECKQYLKNKADEERNKRKHDFEESQKTTKIATSTSAGSTTKTPTETTTKTPTETTTKSPSGTTTKTPSGATTTKPTTTTTKAPTTTTPPKTPDDLLLECCQEHKDIVPGCYGYCKYSQIQTNTLTQMYSNGACRPGMKTWFNCASREMDHVACCTQAAVDKAPGNPICMNLCQSTIASVTINASYLPCLYLIDRIGRCFQADVQVGIDNGDI
jgi:hypothetical protein